MSAGQGDHDGKDLFPVLQSPRRVSVGSQGDKWLSPSDLQRETWLTDLSGDRVTLADLGALEVPHCKPHGGIHRSRTAGMGALWGMQPLLHLYCTILRTAAPGPFSGRGQLEAHFTWPRQEHRCLWHGFCHGIFLLGTETGVFGTLLC